MQRPSVCITTYLPISTRTRQAAASLAAYALSAGSSLAVGSRLLRQVLEAVKRNYGIGKWVRRGMGALVLLGVMVMIFDHGAGALAAADAADVGLGETYVGD